MQADSGADVDADASSDVDAHASSDRIAHSCADVDVTRICMRHIMHADALRGTLWGDVHAVGSWAHMHRHVRCRTPISARMPTHTHTSMGPRRMVH